MYFLNIFLDLIRRPKIQFLECRLSAKGPWIQLMSEEIYEPVDVLVKFTLSYSKSGYKGHQGCAPGI